MAYINNSYSVLAPAGAGDSTLTGTTLQVTGCPAMDVRLIQTPVVGANIVSVAETLSVWTITTVNPSVASGNYGILIRQTVHGLNTVAPVTGLPQTYTTNYLSAPVRHTSPAATETNVNTADALKRGLIGLQDPAIGFRYGLNALGAATVVITALAGSPLISVSNLTVPPAAFTSIVNTTPGVASRGTVDDLLRAGVAASLLTVGNTYSTIVFNYLEPLQSAVMPSEHLRTHTLYVDEAAAGYAAFIAALTADMGSLWI